MNINTWRDATSGYNDWLDELYGDTDIAGMQYQTSRVLREVDPIAYRTGLDDWLDSEGIDSDTFEGDE